MQTTTGTRPKTQVPWTTDLSIVVAAMVSATVLWVSAAVLGGVDLFIQQGDDLRQVGGLSVVVTAGVAAALGALAMHGLERLVSRPVTIWTGVACTVAVLSLLGPLGATTASATGTLMALHAVVAAVVITAVRRSRRAHDGTR